MNESAHNIDHNCNHDDAVTLVSHQNNNCLCGYTLSDVPPLLTRCQEDDHIDNISEESESVNHKYPMRNKIDNDFDIDNVRTSVNDPDSENIVHEMGGISLLKKVFKCVVTGVVNYCVTMTMES